MSAAIMADPNGAEIAYYLNRNQKESKSIYGLDYAGQIKAINDLSKKFATTQTSAPEPIQPVSGNDGFAGKDPNKMSPSEYREWSNRRRAKRRGL